MASLLVNPPPPAAARRSAGETTAPQPQTNDDSNAASNLAKHITTTGLNRQSSWPVYSLNHIYQPSPHDNTPHHERQYHVKSPFHCRRRASDVTDLAKTGHHNIRTLTYREYPHAAPLSGIDTAASTTAPCADKDDCQIDTDKNQILSSVQFATPARPVLLLPARATGFYPELNDGSFSLLDLPCAWITSKLIPFLTIPDICRLSATCRPLRLLTANLPEHKFVKPPANNVRSTENYPESSNPSYQPDFPYTDEPLNPLDDLGLRIQSMPARLIIGDKLLVRAALYGGIESHLRHRFLGHMTNLNGLLYAAVAQELRARSLSHTCADGDGAQIRFLKPYSDVFEQATEAAATPCEFAIAIADLLESEEVEFSASTANCSATPKVAATQDFLVSSSKRFEEEINESNDSLSEQSPNHLGRRVASSPCENDVSGPPGQCSAKNWIREDEQKRGEAAQATKLARRLALRGLNENEPPMNHHWPGPDSAFAYLISRECVSLSDSLTDEIGRDVDRTLPSHFLFQGKTEKIIKEALFNVLRAIALLEPGMGYCQGMNFIAASLLIETLCPATAFWTLLALIRQRSLSGIFSPGVPALRVRLIQFRELSRMLVPRAYESLRRLGLQTDLVGHQCFITAFAYFLHPSVLVRFWDALFLGGNRVLVLLALVILRLMEDRLRKAVDVEHALREIQAFRMFSVKVSTVTTPGLRWYRRMCRIFLEYQPHVTSVVLGHIAVTELISNLRTTVKKMDLPHLTVSPNSRSAPRTISEAKPTPIRTIINDTKNSSSSSAADNTIVPPSAPHELMPPYLLVPRFQNLPEKRTLREEDVRAVLVNYVTKSSSQHFQLCPTATATPLKTPTENDDGSSGGTTTETSGTTMANQSMASSSGTGGKPARLSWSLLASQSTSISPVAERSLNVLVRGRGVLTLTGFYVIVDARFYLTAEVAPSIRGLRESLSYEDELSEPPDTLADDALKRELFGNALGQQMDSTTWSVFENGTCEEILELFESGTFIPNRPTRRKPAQTDRVRHDGSVQEFDEARKNLKEATELLNWIRQHNLKPGELGHSTMMRRNWATEGFIVMPLRALLHAKMQFDKQETQLASDRLHFEEKIAILTKQIGLTTKELDRVKERVTDLQRNVATLEREKYHLMESMSEAAMSPKNQLQFGPVTPVPSTTGPSAVVTSAERSGLGSLWSRLGDLFVPWSGRASPIAVPPVVSPEVRRSSGGKSVTFEDKLLTEGDEIMNEDDEEDDGGVVANSPETATVTDGETVSSDCSPWMLPSSSSSVSVPSSAWGLRPRLVVEENQQRILVKIEKRLKQVERLYVKTKTKLAKMLQRLGGLEDSLEEAREVKITLGKSYHELTLAQEAEETHTVKEVLMKSSDWVREPLPTTLLKIAGIVAQESSCSSASAEVPDLYSELIALPLLQPQFRMLFSQYL